jgi:hypothetical protein
LPGNLFGFYWFCIPFSNLVYLLTPWVYTSRYFVQGPARHLGFEPYVKEIAQHSKLRIWMECLLAFSYQALVWWALDLNWQGWLLCHWAFALHWSALQYVDHAWSPRDIVNGAWNLKVSPIFRALALNYHYHLLQPVGWDEACAAHGRESYSRVHNMKTKSPVFVRLSASGAKPSCGAEPRT